jgi:hypothetical protein
LPEPSQRRQAAPDLIPDLLDPEAAVGVDEDRAVEDSDRPDGLGPPEILRPDHAQIRRAQPIRRHDGASSAHRD